MHELDKFVERTTAKPKAEAFLGQEVVCHEKQRRVLLTPAICFLVYLVLSVVLYIIGPEQWLTHQPVLFYTLLIMYITALWVGYRFGVSSGFGAKVSWLDSDNTKIAKWMPFLMSVNCFILIVTIFRDYGFTTFDFRGLIGQMVTGFENPGLGYSLRALRIESTGADVLGGNFFTLVSYLWAFVKLPIVIASVLLFKKLCTAGKTLTIVYLILLFLYYYSIGTNIQLLHVCLLVLLPVMLTCFTRSYRGTLTRQTLFRSIAVVIVGVICFGCIFTWMLISRGGINSYNQPGFNIGGVGITLTRDSTNSGESAVPAVIKRADVDKTPPTFSLVDTSFRNLSQTKGHSVGESVLSMGRLSLNNTSTKSGKSARIVKSNQPTQDAGLLDAASSTLSKFWIGFTSYLTQGYYGMSMCLTESWVPMFGLGSNMCIVDFFTEHISDIDQYTYQKRVEKTYGWDSKEHWASFYSWLANDFSFPGVIIVMFALGLLFGAMFQDAIRNRNLIAQISSFYWILLILFIPCNNQIGQSPDTLFSFFAIIVFWLLTKMSEKLNTNVLLSGNSK